MKLGKLLLIGAIVFGFGACNNENVPEVQHKNGTVSLMITQNALHLKSTGASDLALKESAIRSLDVFVFNGEAVDGYKRAEAVQSGSLNKVEGIGVTVGPRTIIVVANAPSGLGSIVSKTALLATVATDLAGQTADAGLLMTSQETSAINVVAGKNFYGYPNGQDGTEFSADTPLPLTRVVARVALIGVKVAFEAPYNSWTFENESVFLFNAKKQSKYFGASLVEGSEFLSGLDLTNYGGPLKPAAWDAAWTVPYLIDGVTDLSAITSTAPIYYYTFENNDANAPASISLRGKLIDGNGDYVTRSTHSTHPNIDDIVDEDGYTHYTVIVNATRGGYSYTELDPVNPGVHDATVKRNTQYNIILKITRPGVDDPTDPSEKADLHVEVVVTPWVVVNQHVDW